MDSEQNVPVGMAGMVMDLKQALFVRDHETVAELYWAILQEQPEFLFKDPVQYEIGRLLEHNGHLGPACEAYRRLIEHQPENKMLNQALRGAGRATYRLGEFRESAGYLQRYLEAEPKGEGVQEARDLLATMGAAADGDGGETEAIDTHPVTTPPIARQAAARPGATLAAGETPQARGDRLRDGQFALTIPTGLRFRLGAVARVAGEFLGLPEAAAKKLLLKQKGLILDELTFTQAAGIIPLVRESGQKLQFVCVPRHLRPYEHYEILRGELHDKGIQLFTADFEKKLRWSAIRMINCGSVANEPVVTLHGSAPIREYRFMASSFDSHSVLPKAGTAFHLDIREFLELLCHRAPDATQSHTVQQVVQKRRDTLQPFANMEEYGNYCLWLLFTHFGEKVSIEEMQLLMDLESRW